MSTMSELPAGWYSDPQHGGQGLQRYWDGSTWTDALRSDSFKRSDESENKAGALVVVGYIMAVVIPLVGFIMGIVACTRSIPAQKKHGPWIIVVSVVVWLAWIAIIVAAAHSGTSTSTTYSY